MGQISLLTAEAVEPPVAPPEAQPASPPAPVEPAASTEATERTSYTKGFKFSAVARVLNGEMQRDVAKDLGLPASVLSYWCSGRGMKRNPTATPEKREKMAAEKKQKRRKHDAEFKAKLLARMDAGETGAQLGKEFSISPSLIYKWGDRARMSGAKAKGKPKANGASLNHAAPNPGASSALDRLIEATIEKKIAAVIEKKMSEVLERKLSEL